MAIQYVVTEAEMLALIEGLELVRLREESSYAKQATIHREEVDALHRTFHRHAVIWAQSIGFCGYRK